MPNITSAGGSFVLEGSLVLDVPAGAVPSGASVSLTATALNVFPGTGPGYVVHKGWQIDGNTALLLNAAAQLNHPLVGGETADSKLRFYSRKDDAAAKIPCQWQPRPESPLGDADVDGGTGYLPPENPSAPNYRSFLALVKIP